jgi:homoserine acetyltransferase
MSPVVMHAAQTNLAPPVGSLAVNTSLVRAGSSPSLTWNIAYPSIVKNYVTIQAPATLTPNQRLYADIRILGQGVTVQNSSKQGFAYVETVGRIQYNGSTKWTNIFDGVQTDSIAQSQGILTTITVNAASALNFSGYYVYNGSNGPTFTSQSGTNIRCMVNGDTPPPYLPAYNAPSLQSFLKPYLDASGKVKIGPMDAIIYMELTHTDPASSGYDFQDLVLLVTFRTS